MYDSPKIDIFEFGALNFVVEILYCFEVITDYDKVFVTEINLN